MPALLAHLLDGITETQRGTRLRLPFPLEAVLPSQGPSGTWDGGDLVIRGSLTSILSVPLGESNSKSLLGSHYAPGPVFAYLI